MKALRWNQEKNAALKWDRRVSFEDIVLAMGSGGLLDIVEHPNRRAQSNREPSLVEEAVVSVEFAHHEFVASTSRYSARFPQSDVCDDLGAAPRHPSLTTRDRAIGRRHAAHSPAKGTSSSGRTVKIP